MKPTAIAACLALLAAAAPAAEAAERTSHAGGPSVSSTLSVGPHGSAARSRPAPAATWRPAPAVSSRLAAATAPPRDPRARAAATEDDDEERPKPAKARPGLYGGGQLGRSGQFVKVRLNRGRLEAAQRATLTSRCRGFGAPLVENIRITPIEVAEDGEYVIESEFNELIPPQVPRIGGLERTGLLTGRTRIGRRGAAAGTIRSRFVLRDPVTDRVRARCGTGLVRFGARIPGRGAGRGQARPRRGDSYFGLTGQRQPFLLRVARGGGAVASAGMAYRVGCGSALGRPLQITAQRIRIRGGRFERRGRFVREYGTPGVLVVRESYRWRLVGRFGADGAAGFWRVIGVARRTDTGERLESCDTKRNRWRARR